MVLERRLSDDERLMAMTPAFATGHADDLRAIDVGYSLCRKGFPAWCKDRKRFFIVEARRGAADLLILGSYGQE